MTQSAHTSEIHQPTLLTHVSHTDFQNSESSFTPLIKVKG